MCEQCSLYAPVDFHDPTWMCQDVARGVIAACRYMTDGRRGTAKGIFLDIENMWGVSGSCSAMQVLLLARKYLPEEPGKEYPPLPCEREIERGFWPTSGLAAYSDAPADVAYPEYLAVVTELIRSLDTLVNAVDTDNDEVFHDVVDGLTRGGEFQDELVYLMLLDAAPRLAAAVESKNTAALDQFRSAVFHHEEEDLIRELKESLGYD